MIKNGDLVTRDGTDLHLVRDITDDGFSAEFVCVVAPETGWIREGESESNLCRRYTSAIPRAWLREYERFRDGPAFPPDAISLQIAFFAGMVYARREIRKYRGAVSDSEFRTVSDTRPT
jgi:hypothetical protein